MPRSVALGDVRAARVGPRGVPSRRVCPPTGLCMALMGTPLPKESCHHILNHSQADETYISLTHLILPSPRCKQTSNGNPRSEFPSPPCYAYIVWSVAWYTSHDDARQRFRCARSLQSEYYRQEGAQDEPKNKITKRIQSDPLFSSKAQNESQLPAPGGGAEARPGCAARCNESLDNVTQNRGNGSWFQVSGVPTARLQSAN